MKAGREEPRERRGLPVPGGPSPSLLLFWIPGTTPTTPCGSPRSQSPAHSRPSVTPVTCESTGCPVACLPPQSPPGPPGTRAPWSPGASGSLPKCRPTRAMVLPQPHPLHRPSYGPGNVTHTAVGEGGGQRLPHWSGVGDEGDDCCPSFLWQLGRSSSAPKKPQLPAQGLTGAHRGCSAPVC